MTRERPPAPSPAPGYRGSLAPRNDRLAIPWVLTVLAVFLLVFVLSFAGLPSKLFATPSENPSASLSPSGSAVPSGLLPSASAAASP